MREDRGETLGGVQLSGRYRDEHGAGVRILKCILVGDSGVGKSSLMLRFTAEDWHCSIDSTIGVEFGVRVIRLGSVDVKMQMWDTAGQEQFRSITRSFYRNAACAFLVYDSTNPDSLVSIRDWAEDVKAANDDAESPPVLVLIANKCDCPALVSEERGRQLAEEHGMLFMRASACTGENVAAAFELGAAEVLRTTPPNAAASCFPASQPARGLLPRRCCS
jgi:Ras-related protein Rab-2A